jgi:hypothetical protein
MSVRFNMASMTIQRPYRMTRSLSMSLACIIFFPALHHLLQTLSRRCGYSPGPFCGLAVEVPSKRRRFVIVYRIASYQLGLNASNQASIRGYRTAMRLRFCAMPTEQRRQTKLQVSVMSMSKLILLFRGPWNAGDHAFVSPRSLVARERLRPGMSNQSSEPRR